MTEPPALPERPPHQCCCLFIDGLGNEGPCCNTVDADSPFCEDCENHQIKEWQERFRPGITVTARLPVTRVTREDQQ